MTHLAIKPTAHIVDILGNMIGRDQPTLRMEKALEMVSLFGPDVFADGNVVFFDPFCKAGELLLACAFHSCWVQGKGKQKLLDIQLVYKEIYQSNRYFGLSPDERHHRLSTRTFLGNTHSHNKQFNNIIRDGHYLSEVDGTLDTERFQREFHAMLEYIDTITKEGKRLIAVGNPPYQQNYKGDRSNTGANPIYQFFLQALIDSKKIEQFLMIIPSRWFAGGRGKALKTFAMTLRNSGQVKQIYDFQNSKTVFPTVEIKGGVCFLHWDINHSGLTTFSNHEEGTHNQVDLSQGSMIIRDAISRSVFDKVRSKSDRYLSSVAWAWNPFGLASNYFDRNHEDKDTDLIECFAKRRTVKKISRSKIHKNSEHIGTFKVVYPKAVSTGGIPHRPDQVFILRKNQVCTETYMVLEAYNTLKEAERLLRYIQTDLVRFLVSIKKITQDITKETWDLVPEFDLSKYDGQNLDQELYRHFALNADEKAYITKKISEWS